MAGLIWKEAWHNPKLRTFTPEEGWLWYHAISWTADHEKNSLVIAETDLLFLAASHGIPQSAVQGLVDKHGLDVSEGGYRVHNYKQRRLAHSRAGRLGGLANAKANLEAKRSSKTVERNSGVGVVKELFETWKGAAGKQARLTPKRERAIKAALHDYEPDEIRDALLGWQNDPWPDRPLYNDPVILLRDGGQIERFRDFQRKGKPTAPPQSQAVKNALALMGRPA